MYNYFVIVCINMKLVFTVQGTISHIISREAVNVKSGWSMWNLSCGKCLLTDYFTMSRFKSKYRSGTVNSKSFVGKVLLRIKWKFELINAL